MSVKLPADLKASEVSDTVRYQMRNSCGCLWHVAATHTHTEILMFIGTQFSDLSTAVDTQRERERERGEGEGGGGVEREGGREGER